MMWERVTTCKVDWIVLFPFRQDTLIYMITTSCSVWIQMSSTIIMTFSLHCTFWLRINTFFCCCHQQGTYSKSWLMFLLFNNHSFLFLHLFCTICCDEAIYVTHSYLYTSHPTLPVAASCLVSYISLLTQFFMIFKGLIFSTSCCFFAFIDSTTPHLNFLVLITMRINYVLCVYTGVKLQRHSLDLLQMSHALVENHCLSYLCFQWVCIIMLILKVILVSSHHYRPNL